MFLANLASRKEKDLLLATIHQILYEIGTTNNYCQKKTHYKYNILKDLNNVYHHHLDFQNINNRNFLLNPKGYADT